MLGNIEISAQSSIRIMDETRKKAVYFDPYQIVQARHDADLVFLTHAHGDHFSPEDIRKVGDEKTVFVVPESMKAGILKLSVPEERIVTVSPKETITVLGYQVETVAAYNRWKPFHPKKNGWVGYIITMEDMRYFISGDTDKIKENEHVSCDVALVPVGGFYTMDAKEAASLVNGIHPTFAVPTHYGGNVGKLSDGTDFIDLCEEGIIGMEILKNE